MARRKKHPLARGILRDKNGVVVGRRSKHPFTGLFTAVPATSADYPDAQIPPLNLPEEFKHLLAQHIFDNLYPGLEAPPGEGETWTVTRPDSTEFTIGPSRYRLVNPTGDRMPMGGNGEEWVAWSLPGEVLQPAADPVDPAAVPDVDDLTDDEFAALQDKVMKRIENDARLAALDEQAKPTEPEWEQWRREQFGRDATEGGDRS